MLFFFKTLYVCLASCADSFLNLWSIINVAKSLFCSSEYNLARILKARLSLPPDTAIANFSLPIRGKIFSLNRK